MTLGSRQDNILRISHRPSPVSIGRGRWHRNSIDGEATPEEKLGEVLSPQSADITPADPHCKLCGDTFYYRRNGVAKPCPFCCCADCGRLKYGDPSGNGCACGLEKQESVLAE